MKRRRFGQLLVALFVAASWCSGRAQPTKPHKPDLSGTWLLDQKKSNAGAVTNRPDLPIKIAHHDPEFRIVLSSQSGGKIIERELVYFTDNRGEVNGATGVLMEKPLPDQADDARVAKSKTKWSGVEIA